MTRPLERLTEAEKDATKGPFWSRVWQGDKNALHVLSFILFFGVLLYVVFPYLYDYLLNKVVEDIIPKLSEVISDRR